MLFRTEGLLRCRSHADYAHDGFDTSPLGPISSRTSEGPAELDSMSHTCGGLVQVVLHYAKPRSHPSGACEMHCLRTPLWRRQDAALDMWWCTHLYSSLGSRATCHGTTHICAWFMDISCS